MYLFKCLKKAVMTRKYETQTPRKALPEQLSTTESYY